MTTYIFLSSILYGAAALGLAHLLLDILWRERVVDPVLGRFEVERRTQLRQLDGIYRWLEPWIDELKPDMLANKTELLEDVRRNIVASGGSDAWHPQEFLAVCQLRGILIGIAVALLVWIIGGRTMGILAGLITVMVYPGMARGRLKKRADNRRKQIKRRFSSMIDLMALMMEVGGSIQQSLEVVTRESQGHPLGDELTLLMHKLNGGTPRREAFRSLGERISDDDISELVTSIVEGERLGTPLSKILRLQSDIIRRKRSQWAEKAAQESQVALVGPAMVIMVACLITVAAPFVLDAMATFGN